MTQLSRRRSAASKSRGTSTLNGYSQTNRKTATRDVSFQEMLESCIHGIRDKHGLPHTERKLPSKPYTAPTPSAPKTNARTQFPSAHSFSTTHENRFPVKTPRLGTPGNLARMGELPHKTGSATSGRSEWIRLPSSPDFYSSDKILPTPPRTLFSRGAKQVDVSAWHSVLVCTHYSAQKAQMGFSDRQGGAAVRWAQQTNRNYHSAFSSEQPRLIALPTGRCNDSKLATSLWGDSHREHYSGAAVGPGSYGALQQKFLDPKYKAILHDCSSNDLGLPQAFKARKKANISELVRRYTGISIECESDRVKRQSQPEVEPLSSAAPGGAIKWGVKSGAEYRKRPVGKIIGRTG